MFPEEIIRRIASSVGLSEESVRKTIELLFENITEGLLEEGRALITDFGTFRVRKRRGRKPTKRRPGKGALTVTFKMSKALGERIEQEGRGQDVHKVRPK